jgi:hypothetical protein
MIRSDEEFIEEDKRIKGRVLLLMMRIYEEKIKKMMRSNGEFIEEDYRIKGTVLLMKRINEEKILKLIYLWSLIIMLANSSLESFPSPSWSHLPNSFLNFHNKSRLCI